MNYKIEKKEAFRIVGVKDRIKFNVEENFIRVPKFWDETVQNGMFEKVCSLSNKEPYGVLGVSTSMNENGFDYYIACSTDKRIPESMFEYEVPACTWVIFQCIGPMPNAIQELQKRIATDWLPNSGYEYGGDINIEVYSDGDSMSSEYKSEVWVPIAKKE